MYITYCIPSFVDTAEGRANFSSYRYAKMPELDHVPSRSTRLANRTDPGNNTDPESDQPAWVDYDTEEEEREAEAAAASRKAAAIARDARLAQKQSELAAKCNLIVKGIQFYESAPLQAMDMVNGVASWFPATVANVLNESTVKIHFQGWHKRHDFVCSTDDPRLQPA